MNATVGGEVDSWCTSCRAMRVHVTIAVVGGMPAKVECLSCKKQHVYRAGPPGTKDAKEPKVPKARASKAKAAAEPARPAPPDDLAERLASGERDAKIYSPKATYAVGDVVKHPTFGLGLVTMLAGAQKMEVAFRDGPKLLLHDRDAQVAATTPSRPRGEQASFSGTSDAPPRRG